MQKAMGLSKAQVTTDVRQKVEAMMDTLRNSPELGGMQYASAKKLIDRANSTDPGVITNFIMKYYR